MHFDHIVVGGGLTGLFIVSRLQARFPEERVLLIEGSSQLGGLMRTKTYDEDYWFDYGPHLTGETGSAIVNQTLEDLQVQGGWNILEGQSRDLPGIYFNGSFSKASTYPDLRSMGRAHYRRYVQQVITQAELKPIVKPLQEYDSAFSYLSDKFGEPIATLLCRQVLQRFAAEGQDYKTLSVNACAFMPVDRVVLFEPDECLEVLNNPALASRSAFIDQRNLPLDYSSGKRNFYPTDGGAQRVADAFQAEIQDAGAEIKLGTKVLAVHYDKQSENRHEITLSDESTHSFKKLYWAASPMQLGAALNIKPDYSKMIAPKTVAFVNLVLKGMNYLADLHYAWFGDAEMKSYRVTNYGSFVSEHLPAGCFKLTVEMHYDSGEKFGHEAIQDALSHLKQSHMIADDCEVIFSALESMQGIFPVPSRANEQEMNRFRRRLSDNSKNTEIFGFNSRPGLFFLRDVMDDVAERVG